MRKPIEVRAVSSEEKTELERLYRETRDVRIRERTQIILLAVEQQMIAPQISTIVRRDDETVRNWIKRFNAQGIAGLYDDPRSGAPAKATPAYVERLLVVVRQRPRSLDQPYSMWTLQRLVEFMAEETGIRVSEPTLSRIFAEHEVVMSRPQHKVSSPDPEYEVKKRRSKRNENS